MVTERKNRLSFWWVFLLMWSWGCSDTNKEQPEPDPVVVISTDKTSIVANNKDKATFTVTVDGRHDVLTSITITQKGSITPVDGMSFSTDSVASYTFFATYNNIKSNEISIEAVDIEIVIVADKQTIKANNKDIVSFSVKAEGEDITSAATIFETGTTDVMLNNSDYYTKITGTHTFYAMYNGKKSNVIHINASAVVVSLSVDKTSIKANNSDKAIFTVKADNEIVTSASVIMQIVNDKEEALDNHEFLTDEDSSYTFFAIYDEAKSNEVTIDATYVELRFLRGYCIAQITSNTCPNCILMTEELQIFQRKFPGQIHVIALHPYGKYCYSELAGALAQTAVSFCDRVDAQPSPPPLAIIDNNFYSHLYATTTQKRLTEALDKSTMLRDRVSLTGMAVKSHVNGGKIDFEVSFKTIKTDRYRFFAFIVEDGVVHRQILPGRILDSEYVHNNVGTYQLIEGDPFFGVDLGVITQGIEKTRIFSIDTHNFNTGRNVNLANCRIICYTLRANNGNEYFVDNVTSCSVNGSVRYLYEK